ncbi:unnamed protein product, partial [Ceratitis capitata]
MRKLDVACFTWCLPTTQTCAISNSGSGNNMLHGVGNCVFATELCRKGGKKLKQ